ncbi:MAG: hypothetical protein DMF06_04550 [Verrucomicrobia bacterium]|nr:MAG: hypothetical protein DMF06_04550 [Verrucomicrobiota bacterium]
MIKTGGFRIFRPSVIQIVSDFDIRISDLVCSLAPRKPPSNFALQFAMKWLQVRRAGQVTVLLLFFSSHPRTQKRYFFVWGVN